MHGTRRDFVRNLSFAAAASVLPAPKPKRLPLAFSTIACPAWELDKILAFAMKHGYPAIELRGLEGNLDLPSHPAFSAENLSRTRRAIEAHDVQIACVSSSASLHEAEPTQRTQLLADAKRFIDLAASLRAPYVRVFGQDTEHPATLDEGLKARVAAGLLELGEYARPRNVSVLIESHDEFTTSAALGSVLAGAASANVGLLWDAFHTFNLGHEDPELTVRQLDRWIRHTHLKDGLASAGEARHYVLTGRGDVPVKRQIRALHYAGYQGFYCFEWEKVWHPELEEPEIALADFARVAADYLREP